MQNEQENDARGGNCAFCGFGFGIGQFADFAVYRLG